MRARPSGGPYTSEEIAFLRDHPGGLDKDFYVAKALPLFQEFCETHGVDPLDAEVAAELVTGEELVLHQTLSTLTYVLLVTVDDEIHIVPTAVWRG